jgi:prepilin-type N-terminal cleavage/methylation domain-containing protein/prepilin-type processing-associated H-X9-DG protein
VPLECSGWRLAERAKEDAIGEAPMATREGAYAPRKGRAALRNFCDEAVLALSNWFGLKGIAVQRKAFTLTELLVAIAMIAILAALLLPGISLSKAQARNVACKNHLKQMGAALQMYVQDSRNRYAYYIGPVGPSYGDGVAKGGRIDGMVFWSTKLFPYYALNWTNPLFQCPGYTGKVTGVVQTNNAIVRYGSYSYNIWGSRVVNPPLESYGLGPCVFWTFPQGSNAPHAAVAESEIVAPSQMLAMGESAWVVGSTSPGLWAENEGGGYDSSGCNANAWAWVYDARHGKVLNQLYCDGHVSSMRPQILFDATNTAALWNYDH